MEQAKYEIIKRDPNGQREVSEEFKTAKSLFESLKNNRNWFYGMTSSIFERGELIGTTSDYNSITTAETDYRGHIITPRPSIKRLKESFELVS